MRKNCWLLWALLLLLQTSTAQLPQFNLQVDEKVHHFGAAYGFVQDQQGYIWFSAPTKGLIRYDGRSFNTIRHDPELKNSPASNYIVSIAIDQYGNLWLAHVGKGLDKYDPVTKTFTNFRNSKTDANSLLSDTVINLLVDRTGKLWIGSSKGLQSLDTKTKKFTRYPNTIENKPVGSSSAVFALYEDKEGIIWFSTFDIFNNKAGANDGLYRLDPKTGKQTLYKADPKNPESLINSLVFSMFEDSRGNFWVGTKGNGLHTLDRKTGKFTRYLYDPSKPGNLSRPPIRNDDSTDVISFIAEDRLGKIWIGSLENGINWYDPATRRLQHFGAVNDKKRMAEFSKDTLTGFKDAGAFTCFMAADGTSWITTISGNIYTIAYGKKAIPFYENKKAAQSFYLEPNGNILWFGTDSGLVRKDLAANTFKYWVHEPKNASSLNNNAVVHITPDNKGKLFIATHTGGLDLFDPLTGKFVPVKSANAAAGQTLDSLHHVFIEDEKTLWLAGEYGLARVDRTSDNYTVYRYSKENVKGIVGPTVYCMARDKKKNLWFANVDGLDKYVNASNSFQHYLQGYSVRAVLVDSKGLVWAGTDNGLYQFDEGNDRFVQFSSPAFSAGIETILNLLEDDQQNIWVSTANGILKINANRENIQMFNASYGILSSKWNWLNNYKAADGRIFIGGGTGYYMFMPEEINVSSPAPVLNFSQLIVGGKEIFPGDEQGILAAPIWNTEKIALAHHQNSFSVDFIALNFNTQDVIKYQYKLETSDLGWNNLGTDHKAYFFNIPPGNYLLRVRAINSEGTITEKTLQILISPPWWKTWWAYCLYVLLAGSIIWTYIQYRSKALRKENQVLEERVEERTKQLQHTIQSLKATQAQLVQSEKMASLGELTAGIAHEIQNPLNFVNNFSEINTEIADELKAALAAGNMQLANEIASDLKSNSEKIRHHGKRADAIVKGMLQHSRSSSGAKESTDINALCDEYLRLAYHGFKAKDKSFNAGFETAFDESIPKLHVIPQDIGRVVLNLINNAFYAVNERLRQLQPGSGYKPMVTVSTKKENDSVIISVADNGNGIPAAIKEKIFQPFFTTKPTGQGTGLGLSLSYDIVTKGHGGDLKVESVAGEGTRFMVILPVMIS